MSSGTDGLLVVDKPAGCTSHDVVDRCRRAFGQRKVGHAGTLDPDATGVLLVGLGKVTRLLRWLSGLEKRYTGEVVLGVATTTLDSAGDITETWDMSGVTLSAARAAAERLTGEISQVPPMVSAIKVGGRRLHELARQGVEVERAPRLVRVTRFEVELAGDGAEAGSAGPGLGPGSGLGPVLAIDVECSSGTYVRSLAADLGARLGGGAHLRNLRRLSVGRFSVSQAVPLVDLEASPPGLRSHYVLAPAEALPGMARAVVGGDLASAVGHGKVLPVEVLSRAGDASSGDASPGALGSEGRGSGGTAVGAGSAPGPWAVLDETGELLAVYEAHGAGMAKPAVVIVGSASAEQRQR